MKKFIVLLLILLPTVAASISLNLAPTQTVQPGSEFTLNVSLTNDEPIWGISFKIKEQPTSDVTFVNSVPQSRIANGSNSASQNGDSVMIAIANANTSLGIQPGDGAIYTLTYSVPSTVQPGLYNLVPEELFVSDSQGNNMTATMTGTLIAISGLEAGLSLQTVYAEQGQSTDVILCASAGTQTIEGIDATIIHDPAIVGIKSVQVNRGTGNYNLDDDRVRIVSAGTAVQNADCSQNSGIEIARITYNAVQTGTTTLQFSDVTLSDQNGQIYTNVETTEGEITVGNENKLKTCSVSPVTGSTIEQGEQFDVTYRISSPVPIGGVDEKQTLSSQYFDRVSVTPLISGATTTAFDVNTNTERVITVKSQAATLTTGIVDLYRIRYQSLSSTPTGNYDIQITDVTVSDANNQDVSGFSTQGCSLTIHKQSSDSGSGSSGGGGGGGNNNQPPEKQCKQCPLAINGTIYECCGTTIKQINGFCQTAPRQPQFCEKVRAPVQQPFQNFVPTSPMAPVSVPEEVPEKKEVKTAGLAAAPVKESTPSETFVAKPKKKSTEDMTTIIIAAIIMLVFGAASLFLFAASRHAPKKKPKEVPPLPMPEKPTLSQTEVVKEEPHFDNVEVKEEPAESAEEPEVHPLDDINVDEYAKNLRKKN